ncbi:MAG: pyridoxal phosphate-dependent aminotransferase [Ornithinimicrobium sp.]
MSVPSLTSAPRTAGLSTSMIRSFAAAAPPGNVSLALGEPGWPLPQVAREALTTWAREVGRCAYGPNQGRGELREVLRQRLGVADERLMISAGSQAALYALFTAHVGEADVVWVPNPGFPAYRTLAHLCGATTADYPLAADGSLDAPALIEALDRGRSENAGRPRLVVLNHPSNPTGGGANPAALELVAQECARRDILVLSDEVYRELPAGPDAPSMRMVSERAIVTESVSKAWAAPGLRVGWATGPPEVLAPAVLVHNAMNTAPAQPSQVAATALLHASEDVLATSRAELAARWDLLKQHAPAWLPSGRPAGGFYQWVPTPWGDDHAWATRLRDHGGVSVVPGSAFGPAGQGHIRISVGGPPDELIEGLRRITDFADRADHADRADFATQAGADG